MDVQRNPWTEFCFRKINGGCGTSPHGSCKDISKNRQAITHKSPT